MSLKKLKLQELNRLDYTEYAESPKIPLIIVLDNLRSALNVGSFFRTCDAFRCEQIILCGITSTPPNKEINKTAIGATMTVDWRYEESIAMALKTLKSNHYSIIGIEQTTESTPLSSEHVQRPTAVVFGNEVEGISNEALPYLDKAVEIVQYGTKHSLNVAVCGGIVLHHFAQDLLPALSKSE